MSIQISVLIPVYNTANHLYSCLKSVQEQTFKDFEIIAINDGSSDESLKILTDFAAQEPRLRVISQSNRGICATRNRLLQEIRGKYFLFLDSDDWLLKQGLELLYNTAVKTGADVVQGLHQEYDPAEDKYWGSEQLFHLYRGPKPPISFKDRFAAGRAYLQVWGRLVETDLVRQSALCFPPDKLAEDSFFSILLYTCAKRIEFVATHILVYRRNRFSSLSANARKMYYDKIAQWMTLARIFYQRDYTDSALYDGLLHLLVKGCYGSQTHTLNEEEKIRLEKAVSCIKDYSRFCSWPKRWRYRLFVWLAVNIPSKRTLWARLLR